MFNRQFLGPRQYSFNRVDSEYYSTWWKDTLMLSFMNMTKRWGQVKENKRIHTCLVPHSLVVEAMHDKIFSQHHSLWSGYCVSPSSLLGTNKVIYIFIPDNQRGAVNSLRLCQMKICRCKIFLHLLSDTSKETIDTEWTSDMTNSIQCTVLFIAKTLE